MATSPPASDPRRRPTLFEVARLAGVSHQTVSRFFRDNASLKAATRDRVAAAVAQLDYRPNLVARSMRTRQTDRLAVIVPALSFNPARMLGGASQAAHDAGFGVDVLSIEGGTSARTQRVIELADAGQVDGIVSLAPVAASLDPVALRIPVVVAAELDDDMRGIGSLADATALTELIDGLVAHGHTRFVHLTGDLEFASARARRQTFVDTLVARGLEPAVIVGDWTAEHGMAAVHAMPETGHPSAVIAANDLIAAGVVRAAHERGWRVPDDISVTGWDDLPLGRYLLPALTTVVVDHEHLGAVAMRRLIAALRGDIDPDATDGTALNRVEWRESTGPAPA